VDHKTTPSPALPSRGRGRKAITPYARVSVQFNFSIVARSKQPDLIDMPLSVSDPTWYPIASSEDLPFRHVYQGQLLGRELAVWRADDGNVNIWGKPVPASRCAPVHRHQ
jgi:hypothetical protein